MKIKFLKVRFYGLLAASLALACTPDRSTTSSNDKMNIVWFSVEDIGPYIAPYGDSTIATPHLNRLAREGIVYDQAFTVAGVCAPNRSSIITSVYPSTLGTHHMRTRGIDIPDQLKCFTQYLREAGYYCTNQQKTDYNFPVPEGAWDEVGLEAHWKNRPEGAPFFAIFNDIVTHESRIWTNRGEQNYVDYDEVPLPEYYPDDPTVREDVARMYNNIQDMDNHLGLRLAELEEAGLLDETVVIFWSDHGGPLPRMKRELHHSGTHVPLIVRFPDGRHAGGRVDSLVSLLDLGPTMLSLTGLPIPDYMQGRAFLGEDKQPYRSYIYGARDRMDHEYDLVRAVYDGQFRYIRNYHPEIPAIQQIAYRMQIPMMRKLLQLREQGKLSPEQTYWFRPSKTVEELYNLENDPDEVRNLADDPQFANKLEELRRAHFEWVERTRDLGMIPEPQLFAIQEYYGTTVYEFALKYPVIMDKVHEMAQIASLGDLANATALQDAMQDTIPTLRYWGAHGMGVIEDLPKSYQSDLYKLLDDPAPVVRLAAAWSLGKQGNQETAVAILSNLLAHETPSVASMAANRLRDFLEYAGPAKEMLEDLSEDNDIVTRGAARMTLELMDR